MVGNKQFIDPFAFAFVRTSIAECPLSDLLISLITLRRLG